MSRPRCALFAVLALLAVLFGCAASPFAPPPAREGEVIARYGQPTEEWDNPDGTRVLMYSDTPMGYGSRRYVIDKDHNVISGGPVISEEGFARLQQGMSQEQVRRELGRPGETAAYSRLNEHVWSWRYVEFGDRRMFFNAHFDNATGRLKHTSRTPEPEPHHRNIFGFGSGFGIGIGF
jgi:hypothetical protein